MRHYSLFFHNIEIATSGVNINKNNNASEKNKIHPVIQNVFAKPGKLDVYFLAFFFDPRAILIFQKQFI